MGYKKFEVISKIIKEKLVAVVRAENEETAIKIVDAIYKGGISIIEITMTVPGAVDIIKKVKAEYNNRDIVFGAGTVLDAETARICILNGAEYIVSPVLNLDMIKLCNRYGIPVVPGVLTPTEAILALEHGVDIVKLFPAGSLGLNIIKNFLAPLPQLNIMPTGGVSLENAKDWLQNGAIALGVGGDLTKIQNGDYSQITKKAIKYKEIVSLI